MLLDNNFESQLEELCDLDYLMKKLYYFVGVQTKEIENTLHYFQKNNQIHQLKATYADILDIFNQMEELFKCVKAGFLYSEVKKIIHCCGTIYFILINHFQSQKSDCGQQQFRKHANFQVQNKIPNDIIHEKASKIIENKQQKSKNNKLGGIFLYNQKFARHIYADRSRTFNDCKAVNQISRQELNKLVIDQLNDISHLSTEPEQALDHFSLKFKFGRKNQISFHDELISITQFFKKAQGEALQFLGKTRDQTLAMAQDQHFSEVVKLAKIQNQKKVREFSQKVAASFRGIRAKTQSKINEISNVMLEQKLKNSSKMIVTATKETQTTHNFQEQIKMLKKQISVMQWEYGNMCAIKKQEAMSSDQLLSQIKSKDKEIIFLKQNIQELNLMIYNQSRKIKSFETSKKLKDTVSQKIDNQKKRNDIQVKKSTNTLSSQLDSEQSFQIVKKQRKSKRMFAKRNSEALIPGRTISLAKRLTLRTDLQQIDEKFRQQINQTDSEASNKNAQIGTAKPLSKFHTEKSPKKLKMMALNKTIKTSKNVSQKKQIVIKQKHTSLVVGKEIIDQVLTKNHLYSNSFDELSSESQNEAFKTQNADLRQISDMNNERETIQENNLPNQLIFNKVATKMMPIQHTTQYKDITYNQQRISQRLLSKYTSQAQSTINNQIKSSNSQTKIDNNIINIEKLTKQLKICNLEVDLNLNLSQLHLEPRASIKHQALKQYQNVITSDSDENNFFAFQLNSKVKTKSMQKSKSNTHYAVNKPLAQFSNSKFERAVNAQKNYLISQKLSKKAIKNMDKLFDQDQLKNLSQNKSLNPNKKLRSFELQRYSTQIAKTDNDLNYNNNEVQLIRQAMLIAKQCKTVQQYKQRITQIHNKRCGINCPHLQRFVSEYSKYRLSKKSNLKMHVQNLTENIRQ